MKSIALILVLLISSTLCAQSQDVCCVFSRIEKDSVEVSAIPKSLKDCTKGQASEGSQVCASLNDENNVCSLHSKKSLCEKCAYYWTGQSCLKEDPVIKAKEELKKEDSKKEKPVPEKEGETK